MNKIIRSFTINANIWNNFKAICAKEGVNMSEIIYILIENYTKKTETKILEMEMKNKDE